MNLPAAFAGMAAWLMTPPTHLAFNLTTSSVYIYVTIRNFDLGRVLVVDD
jgi:hypothetical protein